MTEKNSEWIVNSTDADFEKQVIERSQNTLCIVDFWAEWCAPCRMLGPILEELTEEFAGKFTLVKVDADQSQQTAMNYGVQSLPAVFSFAGGEPVDGFTGVLPKEQIHKWIEGQLSGNEIFDAVSLAETEPEKAIELLIPLMEKHPDEMAIKIGLASAHQQAGNKEAALAILTELEERGFLEPEAEKIKARLEMDSKGNVDLDQAQKDADSNPDDFSLQLNLANALVGHQRYEDAFQICLELVRRDKTGAGDQARQLMVDVFKSLPDDSQLTHDYRRKLSLALY